MFNQMSSFSKSSSSGTSSDEEIVDLRRGPWTMEEDNLLVRYIVSHGEGRWNNLAKCSGLKRTGKSCRLRWLNYLKPDVKRGNLTPQEQLLILQLYSKWGNRWSKIAKQLPGRTDNEIKNYWRTRVQKQARHLKIDTNSTKFQDMIQCIWMPRLLEKIQQSPSVTTNHQSLNHPSSPHVQAQMHHGLDLDHMNSSSGEVFTDCSLDQFMHFPQVTQVLSGSPISPLCADEYDTFVNMESAEAARGANIWTHEEIEVSLWNMDELWELQEMEN